MFSLLSRLQRRLVLLESTYSCTPYGAMRWRSSRVGLVRVDRKYGVHGCLSNLKQRALCTRADSIKVKHEDDKARLMEPGDNVGEEHGMTRVRIRKSPVS